MDGTEVGVPDLILAMSLMELKLAMSLLELLELLELKTARVEAGDTARSTLEYTQ